MRMVSVCLVGVLVFLAVLSCDAAITVAWKRGAYMYVNYVAQSDPANVALPAGALLQLIWSADNTYAVPIAGSIPGAGSQYSGGDWVLASVAAPANGGGTADWDGTTTAYYSSNVGGANINQGYLYCFVFATNAANIVAGTMYGQSTIVAGPFNDTVADPILGEPEVNPSPDQDNRLVLNTTGLTVQAIPEPGTLALLGIGLAVVALRRSRK